MTTSPVDPNRVLLTGENSFIRLAHEEGDPQLTRVSHWRVLLSPAGPGHVLFLKSDVVGNEVLVYSDNIALTRWLQGEIESMLFPEFADLDLPVIDAAFTKSGDVRLPGMTFWSPLSCGWRLDPTRPDPTGSTAVSYQPARPR